MNKEEILKMSQQENKGKMDEREASYSSKASQVSRTVGVIACLILVAIDKMLLEKNDISVVAFMILSYMSTASQIVLYKNLKKRSDLVWLILSVVCSLSFTAIFVYKMVTKEFI